MLAKIRALDVQKKFAGVPLAGVEGLDHADNIVFGTPTRLGNICGPLRQFLAATGQVWVSGALIGKIRSVFTRYHSD